MQVSAMDLFEKAKTVRLKSHHQKYLTADDDGETVTQIRSGIEMAARWTVEFVEEVETVIRLKSCYGKYLTALDEEYLVTGSKVAQSLPRKLDSSVEWEPIRDGQMVKLKTRYGNYLRANGGLPPWRNSITHDIPHRHHDWILWDVDILEVRTDSLAMSFDDLGSSFHISVPKQVSMSDPSEEPSMKSEGRLIHYRVVDDDVDDDDDEKNEENCFQFKGNGVEELTQKLVEETGIPDVIVCTRNVVNGKLCPLRLALPPNNTTMHVVLVPPTSRAARGLK